MLKFFYNTALLFFGLMLLPKILWQWWRLGKYRMSLLGRLGMQLPPFHKVPNQQVIWIHTISVGEARAVMALYSMLRQKHPKDQIILSCITETGYAELRRSMPLADALFFLPLDFSWCIKRAVNHFQPDLLILVESDFWYHLIKFTKERGGKVLLINGKISERSLHRFQKVRFFAKRLFSNIDLFCTQNATYAARFSLLSVPHSKIQITANLKLDVQTPLLTDEEKESWRQALALPSDVPIILLGSTHEPEEELLLSAMRPVLQQYTDLILLIIPRHIERSAHLMQLLEDKQIPAYRYTERAKRKGGERAIVIDAMGLLRLLYQIATVAIVGGSFIQRIGGHNVFEPAHAGTATLFGPYMHAQEDMRELVLSSGAALQVSLPELAETLLYLLDNEPVRERMQEAGLQLGLQSKGATMRTFAAVENLLSENLPN